MPFIPTLGFYPNRYGICGHSSPHCLFVSYATTSSPGDITSIFPAIALEWIRLPHMRSYTNTRSEFLRDWRNSHSMSRNTNFHQEELSPRSRNFQSIFLKLDHNSLWDLCMSRARDQHKSLPTSAFLRESVTKYYSFENVGLTKKVISWYPNHEVCYQNARTSWSYFNLVNSEFLLLRIFNPENDSLITLQAQLLIECFTLCNFSHSRRRTHHTLISDILPLMV